MDELTYKAGIARRATPLPPVTAYYLVISTSLRLIASNIFLILFSWRLNLSPQPAHWNVMWVRIQLTSRGSHNRKTGNKIPAINLAQTSRLFPVRLHTTRSPTDCRMSYEGEHRIPAMGGFGGPRTFDRTRPAGTRQRDDKRCKRCAPGLSALDEADHE
jgi:hypothetical protein